MVFLFIVVMYFIAICFEVELCDVLREVGKSENSIISWKYK